MTILCELDQQTAAAMLAGLGPDTVVVATLSEAALALSAEPHRHLVVVVGGEVPIKSVVEFTEQLHTDRPEIAVVLVRQSADPVIAQLALTAGVAEVVVAGDLGGLARACMRAERSAALPPQIDAELDMDEPPPRQGEIVTVFAAKGGCGKTTTATNLAVVLSADGARRVCLVDLDLDFGDVAISMRLTPNRTLVDAVDPQFAAQFADDGARLDALTVSYSPGLDCVLAPVEPGDAEKVPAGLVGSLLEGLRNRYDYVVIDTPSHFSEQVLAALDRTDRYVLVTTPEIPSLKNLRLTLDMFDLLSYGRDKRLIVFNRSGDQTGLTAKDIETTVKSPITAHIPASRDVPVSINKGVPLAAAQPQHPVSSAIRDFAAQAIVGQHEPRDRRLRRRKPARKR